VTQQSSIDRAVSIKLLLTSIAVEERVLAHIIHAEAEKIQFILGKLHPSRSDSEEVTFSDLSAIQDSVRKLMEDVVLREVMLQMKLTDIMSALENSNIHSHTTL